MGILLLVFFLSGVSALAYQIIWIRLFGLVFGGTVVSMSVVVAVFMGGLALGSHLIGNYAVRVGNRVRLYGILEVVLGLVAIAVFYGIERLAGLIYLLPFAHDIHSVVGITVRVVLSAALLIIPTVIMGGTLPVLLRAVTREKSSIVKNTGLLYAVNTCGAMAGAFLVGFVLIRAFGVTATNFLAAAINICMGVVAVMISGRFDSAPDRDAVQEKDGLSTGERALRFPITLAVTGFAGLTLEMVWMRMMLLTFNNTIYLYTIIISIYLLGLSLGGMLLRMVIPAKRYTEWMFGLILSTTAVATLFGFVIFPWATHTAFYTNFAYYSTFVRLSWLTVIVFTLLGFLPVLMMGMSFPLGVGLYAREVKGLSRRVGRIFAVNTAGSLIGSLAAVFVLIPAIGMSMTLLLCAAAMMIAGLYFMIRERSAPMRNAVVGGLVGLFCLLAIVGFRADIPASILSRRLAADESIEYLREGPSSTIWISGGGPFRKIWMDNLWISSTSNEGTHALLAHYPLLFHKDPKTVCGIAFGTGQTFGTCLLYPIDQITSVEIDGEVIEACRGRFTEENFGILEDSRNRIVIDDGRFFLAGTDEKFDIITAEPLQPYTRGTVSLYSREFYEACNTSINPGGIVAQWLPVYNSGVNDCWSMIRTFAEVFEYAALFLNGSDGILLGSNEPLTVDAGQQVPPLAINDLTRVFNRNIYALTGNYICGRDALLRATADYPVITDDHPTLEYTAPISHWNEDVTSEVEMRKGFISLMEPVETLFDGPYDAAAAETYHGSREMVNRGFYAERTGQVEKAQKLYEDALRLNPDDLRAKRSLYFFLRRYKRQAYLSDDIKPLFTRPNPDME